MLKLISNIQISRRLLLAFLLAAVIPGIVITLLGYAFIEAQAYRSQAIQANITAFNSTNTIADDLPRLQEILDSAYQHAYGTSSATTGSQTAQIYIIQLHTLQNAVGQEIQKYNNEYVIATSPDMSGVKSVLVGNNNQTNILSKQQTTLKKITSTSWPDYEKALQQTASAINEGEPLATVEQQLALEDTRYNTMESDWQNIVQITEDVNSQVAQIGPTQTNPLLVGTIIAFLSTIIIVSLIGYLVYRTITYPLHQLAALTRRIARGETNVRANASGHDEIAMVATSMNSMLDNIVRLIQDTQYQRDALQGQVEKLVSEVSGVGEGDLRVQAEVTADALGVLADSFNYMIEELGSLVVRVKTVSSEVGQSTTTILERMTQLVQNGNAQITQIGQAGGEVSQMTESSRQVAERSQILYDVARVAREDAQLGRESVEMAVEGMGRIKENVQETASKVQNLGERSREINEIVEAISSIAHQTNRLALDAAIQSAMAGENGKGFGAVAADIRRLAERAKDQAGMIGRIVRGVREDIAAVAIAMQDTEKETASGAQLTQEAGVALESIFAAVEHQAREIENINKVARQQLQSSNMVVQIMDDVSASTQESSQRTKEASQHMERLAKLVDELRTSVEAFKLRADHAYRVQEITSPPLEDGQHKKPLTISGVLRTVSSPLQIAQGAAAGFTPVPSTNDPSTPMPPIAKQTGSLSQPHWPVPTPKNTSQGGWLKVPPMDNANNQWDDN